MRYFLLILLPFFLFGEIVKFEKPNPYYYENQIVTLKAKLILPSPKKIHAMPIRADVNITAKNPYIYNITVKFKADNKEHKLMLTGKHFFKEINLNKIIKKKKLNPPTNYSNVLAKELKVLNPISTKYDQNSTILSFKLKCKECNIEDFKLNVKEQNLTVLDKNEASYYAVIPNVLKKINFYYFNINKETFERVEIPIKLKQETISTQTELNPEENKIFTPVNILILILIAFGLIVFLIYQKVWLLVFPLLLGALLVYILLPKGEIVLSKNTKIQILPTKQSTVIYISKGNEKAKVLNRLDKYTKIKINGKTGWVKNEDIR